MRLERITDRAHPMYRRAMDLYRISFPPHEQREAHSQEAILGEKDYHFTLAYDADTFVGLALYWETDAYLYLEHLCILPQMRNRRYGQQILAALQQQGRPVLLEIDPPVDPLSRRRKGFYERCGFVETPYPHIHPPYHRDCPGHALVLMAYPGPLEPEQYRAFCRYLRQNVMGRAF